MPACRRRSTGDLPARRGRGRDRPPAPWSWSWTPRRWPDTRSSGPDGTGSGRVGESDDESPSAASRRRAATPTISRAAPSSAEQSAILSIRRRTRSSPGVTSTRSPPGNARLVAAMTPAARNWMVRSFLPRRRRRRCRAGRTTPTAALGIDGRGPDDRRHERHLAIADRAARPPLRHARPAPRRVRGPGSHARRAARRSRCTCGSRALPARKTKKKPPEGSGSARPALRARCTSRSPSCPVGRSRPMLRMGAPRVVYSVSSQPVSGSLRTTDLPGVDEAADAAQDQRPERRRGRRCGRPA